MNKKYIYLALIAFLIGGIVSLFASSSPDGLEKVAEDKGFIQTALDYPFQTLLPDYTFPVNNEYLATALAGTIGTVVVFLIILLAGKVLFPARPGAGT
ncbi:PDGLE domain-containing protein [Patescibacteria group bacterium]|nr:PDGLE domain-containing protein [Patescibacteria group bacterium]MBU0964398.1 PDGLE domain-containing protein [Patescibacteria group bacterium]